MSGRTRAFTLMELLVVVAIIALLVGIVIVSMRTVRASAARTDSLSALRQMAMAYTSYTEDSAGRLMPGYIDATLFNPGEPFADLVVRQPSGTLVPDADMQSYVWRLAPYVDNAWQTFFADTSDPTAMSRFNADFGEEIYGPATATAAYGGISERPSFGMNSIFVGGDSLHGGAIAIRHPWQNDGQDKIAAVRLAEVKNPSRLIVFGPAARATGESTPPIYDEPGVGFCELRPPYLYIDESSDTWVLPQWGAGQRGLVFATPDLDGVDVGAGLPIDRQGRDRMPVAHLDGSTEVEQFGTLSRDMRRWNPFEVGRRATTPPAAP
jgi:prepilin-type N-terminal cleavage/methylation domain-containing protein